MLGTRVVVEEAGCWTERVLTLTSEDPPLAACYPGGGETWEVYPASVWRDASAEELAGADVNTLLPPALRPGSVLQVAQLPPHLRGLLRVDQRCTIVQVELASNAELDAFQVEADGNDYLLTAAVLSTWPPARGPLLQQGDRVLFDAAGVQRYGINHPLTVTEVGDTLELCYLQEGHEYYLTLVDPTSVLPVVDPAVLRTYPTELLVDNTYRPGANFQLTPEGLHNALLRRYTATDVLTLVQVVTLGSNVLQDVFLLECKGQRFQLNCVELASYLQPYEPPSPAPAPAQAAPVPLVEPSVPVTAVPVAPTMVSPPAPPVPTPAHVGHDEVEVTAVRIRGYDFALQPDQVQQPHHIPRGSLHDYHEALGVLIRYLTRGV